jgi:hypothetical protein
MAEKVPVEQDVSPLGICQGVVQLGYMVDLH